MDTAEYNNVTFAPKVGQLWQRERAVNAPLPISLTFLLTVGLLAASALQMLPGICLDDITAAPTSGAAELPRPSRELGGSSWACALSLSPSLLYIQLVSPSGRCKQEPLDINQCGDGSSCWLWIWWRRRSELSYNSAQTLTGLPCSHRRRVAFCWDQSHRNWWCAPYNDAVFSLTGQKQISLKI